MTCRLVALTLLLTALPAAGQKTLTYADLLGQLHDFDRLMLPHTGLEAGQFSSFHRDEFRSWGVNADAGNYVREEPNGEVVMMELDGPGCIYRTWSANPMGTIRIYLDGATEPSYEFEFIKLFDGTMPPFAGPIVYRRGADVHAASDCYLPIPFAKHIKITQDQRRGQFYIFNYLKFPDDWQVPSFRLPLSADEQAALDAANAAWSACGTDPKPRLAGQQTIARTLTIEPGQTVTLADLTGGGQIRAIRLKAESEQRYYWRKLVLQGNFDGADWPQILTPVGPFFGFDWVTAEYAALPAGCVDGQGYFYYPMPYRDSARLTLRSYLDLPATISYEVEHAPAAPPDDMLYFIARWRTEKDSTTFDYPFIETAGAGHLVGITLQIDHPIGGWWGEGDEKVWIDDDTFPRWIGTGSEDYFGDAWGIRYLPGASWGCSYFQHPKTSPYRWHFVDLIPFEQRLRMTIENYGVWGDHRPELEYNSVAYWYQREQTPPFRDLRGQFYTGGDWRDVPHPRPYNPDLFRPIRAGDLLTTGIDIPGTIEAEQILGGGAGRLITDVGRDYEFSLERAVAFDAVSENQTLARFELTVPESLVYYPAIHTAPRPDLAPLTLELNGTALQVIERNDAGRLELTGIYLEAGRHQAVLRAAGAGTAIFDCLALQRAQRAAGVMEAESMQVTASEGCQLVRANVRGFSAGQALAAIAQGPGASVTFKLDALPEQQYVLGLRSAHGAMGVQLQAFVAGQPIGPVFDTYAEIADGPKPMPTTLPLGMIPRGAGEVELRIVGRHADSAGWHMGLDYFVWEPLITHPASTPGVWSQVLETRGCEYRIQNLGGDHVGGHHLWIQPCGHNGFVDIAVWVPEEGEYRIETRLTTSWDYAIVQAFLDGQPIGERMDTFTEQVLMAPPVVLTRAHLTAGRHVLRFQAVDKNEASAGYLMGIDYVKVSR